MVGSAFWKEESSQRSRAMQAGNATTLRLPSSHERLDHAKRRFCRTVTFGIEPAAATATC